MKTLKRNFSQLQKARLSKGKLNVIRGGSGNGRPVNVDEDVLIPD